MSRVRRGVELVRRVLLDLVSVCDPVFLAYGLRRAADSARARRRFRAAGGSLAPGSTIVSLACLEIGAGASVQSGCLIHCGGLDWSGGRGHVRLGARSYVGHHCVLYGSGGLDIGDDVLLGPGVTITSQGHTFADRVLPINRQPHLFAPVSIGAGAWIGAGALVMPGVSIGAGAVVAAGAVVTRDVLPFQQVAGVPARVVRDRPGAAPQAATP